MKLNFDDVREMLLEIEEKSNLKTTLKFSPNNENDSRFYALSKLLDASYIDGKKESYLNGDLEIHVYSITWSGHQFLDNIRSSKAVEHTKNVIRKIGSVSIQIMSQVAANYVMKSVGL